MPNSILIIYDNFDTLIYVGAYSSRAYGIDVVEIIPERKWLYEANQWWSRKHYSVWIE